MRDLNICLIKIAEECGEVVQIACKSHRYGLHHTKPSKGVSNKELLIEELGDVLAYIKVLVEDTSSSITYDDLNKRRITKYNYIKEKNIVPEI
jgi:NTP pyrophosphatase (non-canonical NTP hydrolase)